jgi:hypothetical protein
VRNGLRHNLHTFAWHVCGLRGDSSDLHSLQVLDDSAAGSKTLLQHNKTNIEMNNLKISH